MHIAKHWIFFSPIDWVINNFFNKEFSEPNIADKDENDETPLLFYSILIIL